MLPITLRRSAPTRTSPPADSSTPGSSWSPTSRSPAWSPRTPPGGWTTAGATSPDHERRGGGGRPRRPPPPRWTGALPKAAGPSSSALGNRKAPDMSSSLQTADDEAPDEAPAAPHPSGTRAATITDRIFRNPVLGPLGALIILVIGFSIFTENFASVDNTS